MHATIWGDITISPCTVTDQEGEDGQPLSPRVPQDSHAWVGPQGPQPQLTQLLLSRLGWFRVGVNIETHVV